LAAGTASEASSARERWAIRGNTGRLQSCRYLGNRPGQFPRP
jgi:hypothetical protein